MRAQLRTASGAPLRAALALLITCVLGTTLMSAAHSGASHKQVAHRAAILTVTSADIAHLLHRSDQPVTASPAAAAPPVAERSTGFANSSAAASSRTAGTPQVRGPPGQALA